MKYLQVETGQLAKRNAAFICLYAKCGEYYHIGMISRKDASLGFPGGKVEGGESLKEAAYRECIEEVGGNFVGWRSLLLCSHAINEALNSHLFTLEVSMQDLRHMALTAPRAEYFWKELSGFCVYKLTPTNIKNLTNTPSAETVQEELAVLFDYFGIGEGYAQDAGWKIHSCS